MKQSSVFPADQLEHLQSKLTAAEYRVLEGVFVRLEAIISEAKMKEAIGLACHPQLGNPNLPLQMRFRAFSGVSLARSVSLKRDWEKGTGRPYCLLDALKMGSILESLVLQVDGMMPARYIRR